MSDDISDDAADNISEGGLHASKGSHKNNNANIKKDSSSKTIYRSFKRILLKVSGEACADPIQKGVHSVNNVSRICSDIAEAQAQGYKICIVVGGGNICRGATSSALGMPRASADYMGMLSTVINALALQGNLKQKGVKCLVQTAIPMSPIAYPYDKMHAERALESGNVVIFAAGIGNPFFTTDTAAVLRAIEMHCDAVIKGSQVDGIYDGDPKKSDKVNRYDEVSYDEVINKRLNVMDAAAMVLAREQKMPVLVFNINIKGNLLRTLQNKEKHTIVYK